MISDWAIEAPTMALPVVVKVLLKLASKAVSTSATSPG